MSFDGLVSVITPAYNCEKYIANTVRCVSAQSIQVLEHIVIDDGSNDSTSVILKELQSKYAHLKVLTQSNCGAGVARNLGIKNASGKYIAFLDSDDAWLPSKLEAQIKFMEENDILISYGDYQEIDDTTDSVTHEYNVPLSIDYRKLLKGCPIGCLTVAYNQKILGKQYMPAIRRGQDWALWLSITKPGVVAFKYPGCLAKYRIIQSSLSKNKIKKLFDAFDIYRKEQRLSLGASLYYLFHHILYVLRKRS